MNEVSLAEYSEQWRSIDWKSVEKTVEKLQKRIYRAVGAMQEREGLLPDGRL